MEQWLDKSLTAYDRLEKKYGKVSIIGFSTGGTLGLILAALEKVDKLILISPFFEVRQRWYYFAKPEIWAKELQDIMPYVTKIKIGQINNPEGLKKYAAYKHMPLKPIAEISRIGKKAIDSIKNNKTKLLWMHSKK